MRLPLFVLRWFHRRHISRPRIKGSRLHRWLGDRILDKSLWRSSPESLSRAWLIGWVITTIPFLPGQSIIAGVLGFMARANLLLCVGLQYLSNPFTAIVHLPACYFLGKLLFGHSPAAAWHEAVNRNWSHVLSDPSILTDEVLPLYLGGVALGLVIGLIGFAVIRSVGHRWQEKVRSPRLGSPLPKTSERA